MFESNSPSVLGSVIISPARSSPTENRSASRSVLPFASDGSVTTSKPHMLAVAGLVPCALSGMSTLLRLCFASIKMIGARHKHARELAVSARHWRKGTSLHACDLNEVAAATPTSGGARPAR